jgi:hypothetical protein
MPLFHRRSLPSLLPPLAALAMATAVAAGCQTEGCQSDGKGSGPAVPASSHPQGKDLVEGAIVLATEKSGGVRI